LDGDVVSASQVSVESAAVGGEISIDWLPTTIEPWQPLLLAAAARHRVDPELLAIIVLVESGGNPAAVSTSGALGLMQVMPATGQDIAQRRGITPFDSNQLYDPAVNIDFGAWYLAEQLRTFGRADDPDWQRSVELAAAAYNGGPGTVRRHLDSGAGLPAEAVRYQAYVGGMWSQRRAGESAAFKTWWDAGGYRLVQAAGADAVSAAGG
jgi:soluble lytic murein transglycosylase-like protein